MEGFEVSIIDGVLVGRNDGIIVGFADGCNDGYADGLMVGVLVAIFNPSTIDRSDVVKTELKEKK